MSIHQTHAPFVRVHTVLPHNPSRRPPTKRYQIPINFMYRALEAAGWDKIIALVKKP